jgi:hypothetical protein
MGGLRSIILTSKTWAFWFGKLVAFAGIAGMSGWVSYATALEKIPRPPKNPAFFDVCWWALSFNDPVATITALLAGFGVLADLITFVAAKPASEEFVREQFVEQRTVIDHNHQAAESNHGEDMAAQTQTQAQVSEVGALVVTEGESTRAVISDGQERIRDLLSQVNIEAATKFVEAINSPTMKALESMAPLRAQQTAEEAAKIGGWPRRR